VTQQTSDARLELAVLGGVYERVDAAADEHHHYDEVVQPARRIHLMVGDHDHQQVVDAARRPAYDESAADHQ